VIYYGETTEELSALSESQPEEYANGTTVWWRWFAPVNVLSRSGLVPRTDLAVFLGYKPTYNFRGFGTLHSGLKEITKVEYDEIVGAFHRSRPIELPAYPIPPAGAGGTGGGEGEVHRRLKEFVAADPSTALNEPGLRTIRVEYPFPTGDRADIVLADAHDRIVAVEVEPSVADNEIIGPLQAIKYRFMLEWICTRAPGDSRAILVAHSISNTIREVCRTYGVECCEVSTSAVSTEIETRTRTAAAR